MTRLLSPASFAFLVMTLLAIPVRSEPLPAAERQKQIQSIEQQIADLQKKLADLKATPPAPTVPEGTLPDDLLKKYSWRPIGPATMGGRITSLAVVESEPTTYYIATASGGLLKTINNGTTFSHLFDRESTVSIGDVAVSQSNPNIVWVGTGESNPRNSVSYGDGVYKSVDAGKTWLNMGLKRGFQTGRILIHPTNPEIVYVGALGRLYGPNEERGMFKTEDGGKTWKKVLYVDDRTGVIDARMDPTDPNTLIVAMWERKRDEFDGFAVRPYPVPDMYGPIVTHAAGSGLHKTTDGGKTWKKLNDPKLNNGLPTVKLGRVGLDYSRKTKGLLFAIIDTEKVGTGEVPRTYLGVIGMDEKIGGVRLRQVTADGPAAKAGLQAGDLVTTADGNKLTTYENFVRLFQTKTPGDKVKLTVTRAGKELPLEVTLGERPGSDVPPAATVVGGVAVATTLQARPYGLGLGGQQANVQNRQGREGFQTGGVYQSKDNGDTWTRINSVNPRPMYFSKLRVDPSDDNALYVLGDVPLWRSTDGGKTFAAAPGRGVHPDHHALWIDPKNSKHLILGCDGGFYASYDRGDTWDHLNTLALGQFYHIAVDNRRPYRVYGGLQDNGSWGGPSRTLRSYGPVNEDWVFVRGGDGFVCRVDPHDPDLIYAESQNGIMGRRNLRTGEQAGIRPPVKPGDDPHRFNWSTPYILSHHNTGIFYCGAQYVFRSVKHGDDLKRISPQLTRTKHGTLSVLAESPRTSDVLWAGSDDGFVWVSKDAGTTWTNVTDALKPAGLPGPRWVACLEPSREKEGRCYAVFDGHRSDDDKPYLFVTEDYGTTWKAITGNLPAFGSTRVLREDLVNPNLLYVGTEFGAVVSANRGVTWSVLGDGLPTVAVHEFAQPTTAPELVAGTHGRSVWVLDVATLRQVNPATLKEPIALFAPQTAVRWKFGVSGESPYNSTDRRFVGQNPARGISFDYHLAAKAEKVTVKVEDVSGKIVREFRAAPSAPGFHRLPWDLSVGNQPAPPGSRRPLQGGFAQPGNYRVVLNVDGKEFVRLLVVELDPNAAKDLISTEGIESQQDRWEKKLPTERDD